MIITTEKGKIFRRIYDGALMGDTINLGIDYSTGAPREDLPEYFEEIDDPVIPEIEFPASRR